MAARKTNTKKNLPNETSTSPKTGLYRSTSKAGKELRTVQEVARKEYASASTLAKKSTKNTLRVEQITGLATWVLGSVRVAQSFLKTKHPMLGGLTPIKAIESDEGLASVERILINIKFGLPA